MSHDCGRSWEAAHDSRTFCVVDARAGASVPAEWVRAGESLARDVCTSPARTSCRPSASAHAHARARAHAPVRTRQCPWHRWFAYRLQFNAERPHRNGDPVAIAQPDAHVLRDEQVVHMRAVGAKVFQDHLDRRRRRPRAMPVRARYMAHGAWREGTTPHLAVRLPRDDAVLLGDGGKLDADVARGEAAKEALRLDHREGAAVRPVAPHRHDRRPLLHRSRRTQSPLRSVQADGFKLKCAAGTKAAAGETRARQPVAELRCVGAKGQGERQIGESGWEYQSGKRERPRRKHRERIESRERRESRERVRPSFLSLSCPFLGVRPSFLSLSLSLSPALSWRGGAQGRTIYAWFYSGSAHHTKCRCGPRAGSYGALQPRLKGGRRTREEAEEEEALESSEDSLSALSALKNKSRCDEGRGGSFDARSSSGAAHALCRPSFSSRSRSHSLSAFALPLPHSPLALHSLSDRSP